MMENSITTRGSYSRSDDSDDSGDVIIVKTREPMHSTTQREQEPVISLDPKCHMNDFQNCSKNSIVSNGTTAVRYPSHLQAERDVRENENSVIDGECGGECDAGEEEEVIEKARRDRMEFPPMPEKVDSPPIESHKKCDLRTSNENPPKHEGNESTARNQDQIPTEDSKDEMHQNTSNKSKKKKSACRLN